jgi:hypothetical protein
MKETKCGISTETELEKYQRWVSELVEKCQSLEKVRIIYFFVRKYLN